jgi:hypothetical protein
MHNFFLENLRNPARGCRAGAMRQFCPGQLDSTQTKVEQTSDFALYTKFSIQGRNAQKGDLVKRITVTLSIFNFST